MHADGAGSTSRGLELGEPTNGTRYEIQIVPVDRGWILETIANHIAQAAAESHDRFRVTITTHPRQDSELTFFLPESAWREDVGNSVRVTYLAHKEDHPGAAALFEEVARKSDYCVTSSSKYAEVLRNDGAREVFVIPLGVDTNIFVPKIRIGVVGRTYHTGRKGESLLAASIDLPFVEFVFTGEGWPFPARYYGERELAELYQSIDFLLVPSLIEGGPVPMLEALAAACPVIAPSDIGMVEDFPHIPFRRGDAQDLRRVLQTEVDRRLALRAAALPCDWQHFGRRHLELFAQLIDRRRTRDGGPPHRPRRTGERCRALLLTHGSEGASKGGPTTRVNNIVAHLRGRGLPVEAADDLLAIGADRYDIVHVFNSWPPDSALAALAAARRSRAIVVFSPIALELANWPLFHPFMERLFRDATDQAEILETLARIRAVTPRRNHDDASNGTGPIEGIPDRFEKLRRCCDLADKIVLLSEVERSFLASIGARVDHAVLIRNGIDTVRMSIADPERFRKLHKLDRYALCVGRFEYRKNQALAALALRDAEIDFVCIGAPGDVGYVDHVRRFGGRNVRVIDRIDDRELLASAYAGADAFVFPSWSEGAPLAAMEAGAAGVPLILSEMSSEREYFGDDAQYVHPADLEGIRDALHRCLEGSECAADRRARSLRISQAVSIQRHADETWALYEQLMDTPPPPRSDGAPVVVDVSSLLHFLRTRQPLTGVPTVEWNVLAEAFDLVPALRCIVYNNVKGRFIAIPYEALNRFDEGTFNSRYWFNADAPLMVDRTAILRFVANELPSRSSNSPSAALDRSTGLRYRMVASAKAALRHAPTAVRNPLTALLRRVSAGFDPFRSPEDNHALAVQDGTANTLVSTTNASLGDEDWHRGAPRLFEHRLGTVLVRETPRYAPVAPVGARLLTLGQSWLSNGPLLDAMLRLTLTRALSLEPYVYDLTYHTGAHLTGWPDNGERFNRLVRLLEHSARVFTESRQVENDLQKLRVSRGFSFSTCRTGLRGRNLAEPDHRSAPRYVPETYVLVVSSFNKRKNHDFLIHVWRDLYRTWIAPAQRPYRLVLVGEVQEERKYGDPAFIAELRRVGIDVHSLLPDGAVAHLMHECAFTAYPSLQEGWGLPVQESLMCGKVCLVSSVLPVAQEVANAGLVRLAPTDFYMWYEALKTWLDNAPMRRAFGERGRTYVPPTWREIAEAIMSDPRSSIRT